MDPPLPPPPLPTRTPSPISRIVDDDDDDDVKLRKANIFDAIGNTTPTGFKHQIQRIKRDSFLKRTQGFPFHLFDNASSRRKIKPEGNENIYHCIAEIPDGNNINYFERIPDEIILKIFQYLSPKSIINCELTCKRFKNIGRDAILWKTLNLSYHHIRIPEACIDNILTRGINTLKMAHTCILDRTSTKFSEDIFSENNNYSLALQHLDLTMATLSLGTLLKILKYCRRLTKLSLENLEVNDEICFEIGFNINLEILNLVQCRGLEAWNMTILIAPLQNLNELNLSWANLTSEALYALVRLLTANIEQLDISGCRRELFDSHIAILVERCPNIKHLDVSDCNSLTNAAIESLIKLNKLEILSLSRCYLLTFQGFLQLKRLKQKNLKILNAYGIFSEHGIKLIEENIPNLLLNPSTMSGIARPTTDINDRSIWGLSVQSCSPVRRPYIMELF